MMVPGELKRLLAGVVAARKEGEVSLERVRGETAALRSLANAGRLVEDNPGVLQLRMLQQLGGSTGNTSCSRCPTVTAAHPRRARTDRRPPPRRRGAHGLRPATPKRAEAERPSGPGGRRARSNRYHPRVSDRGLPIADGAHACPFVAFEDERDERSTVPDHHHRCYAENPPAPRALAHQEAYCLSTAFPVCPTFQDWARRESARARTRRRRGRRRHRRRPRQFPPRTTPRRTASRSPERPCLRRTSLIRPTPTLRPTPTPTPTTRCRRIDVPTAARRGRRRGPPQSTPRMVRSAAVARELRGRRRCSRVSVGSAAVPREPGTARRGTRGQRRRSAGRRSASAANVVELRSVHGSGCGLRRRLLRRRRVAPARSTLTAVTTPSRTCRAGRTAAPAAGLRPASRRAERP